MNWRAYGASLRQRGSLGGWVTDEAIVVWQAEPGTTQGGKRWYSPLVILTTLTLRAVFRLAPRQTEGLIGSIAQRRGLDLAVPDNPTHLACMSHSARSGYSQNARHLRKIAAQAAFPQPSPSRGPVG